MSRTIPPAGLAAIAALFLLAIPRAPGAAIQEAADPTAELIQTLKQKTDTAEPKLIQELGGKRTRQAMEGLLDVYKAMSTIYMRREVLRALVLFDGVPDAEQPALQRLMDIATQATEPELRRAALDGLGQCRTHGKDFLRMIVTSPAEDSVREHAMELHVAQAAAEDHEWYREIYKPKVEDKADKDKKKKDEKKDKKKDGEPAGPRKPRSLSSIRGFAFGALLSALSADDVVEATKDRFHEIRVAALKDLERRQDKRTLEIATALFEKMTTPDSANMDLKIHERAEVRAVAAEIIGRLAGTKVAPEFLKRATAAETPMELRRALAEILAGFKDAGVNRELISALGKGRPHEKLFVIWAVKKIQDDKVDRALEKQLLDREPEVAAEACRALAERGDKDAVSILQRLVRGKEREVKRAALDALAVLRKGEPAWLDDLVAMTKDQDPELRNLALQALGATNDKSFLPKLLTALDDKNWSTRLAALEALEHLKMKEAISAIIVRMGQEEGRMLDEFANTLWRLTGQPYQDDAKAWNNWWKQFGPSFQILGEEELQRVKSGEEEWRLKQTTRVETKFFGIRIISHRVIFIIDISGSMNEALTTEYEGKAGQPRMEVAKRELQKSIQGLDNAAFFNVITFSSDVDRWIDGSLAAANEKNRKEAKDYAEKLGAGGGTNIYGAMQEAFADPDVDTIFFLTDGEPSVGEVTDPLLIRERVAQWNEHRGIVINTIAVGGQFDLLEWLAADSGGTHVKYE